MRPSQLSTAAMASNARSACSSFSQTQRHAGHLPRCLDLGHMCASSDEADCASEPTLAGQHCDGPAPHMLLNACHTNRSFFSNIGACARTCFQSTSTARGIGTSKQRVRTSTVLFSPFVIEAPGAMKHDSRTASGQCVLALLHSNNEEPFWYTKSVDESGTREHHYIHPANSKTNHLSTKNAMYGCNTLHMAIHPRLGRSKARMTCVARWPMSTHSLPARARIRQQRQQSCTSYASPRTHPTRVGHSMRLR